MKGRGEWHLLSSFVDTGSSGNYTRMYANYVGTTFHDGYLSRHYSEGWQRQRTQTEYSYWDHFVRAERARSIGLQQRRPLGLRLLFWRR